MAQNYLFFNSTENDPRTYQASDFANYFGSVLSTGLIHTDEIPGMEVTHSFGMEVAVDEGKAIMNGHLYENTSSLNLQHNLPPSTDDRIDRVVLRLDHNNRDIRLHIIEGNPSSDPQPPALTRTASIYEISLAQVYLHGGTSVIDPDDITDERLNSNVCGLANSMLTVPTDQFEAEWQAWFDSIQDQSPTSQADFDAHTNSTGDDDVHGLLSGGKIIEERGENENGNYVKFSDGTQLCWGRGEGLPVETSSGALYRSETFQVPFASEFLAGNEIAISINVAALNWWADISGSSDTGYCNVRMFGTTSTSSSFGLRYLAIGRWK